MKKDKEWLKEKVREIARRVGDEHLYINIDTMLKLIDQLDEPEVLSQEWMKDNQLMKISPEGVVYYVPVENLQNLLVPKQGEGGRR